MEFEVADKILQLANVATVRVTKKIKPPLSMFLEKLFLIRPPETGIEAMAAKIIVLRKRVDLVELV